MSVECFVNTIPRSACANLDQQNTAGTERLKINCGIWIKDNRQLSEQKNAK